MRTRSFNIPVLAVHRNIALGGKTFCTPLERSGAQYVETLQARARQLLNTYRNVQRGAAGDAEFVGGRQGAGPVEGGCGRGVMAGGGVPAHRPCGARRPGVL